VVQPRFLRILASKSLSARECGTDNFSVTILFVATTIRHPPFGAPIAPTIDDVAARCRRCGRAGSQMDRDHYPKPKASSPNPANLSHTMRIRVGPSSSSTLALYLIAVWLRPKLGINLSAKAVRAVKVSDQSSLIHPAPNHIVFLVRGKTRRGAMPLSLPASPLA
jgi:hypothetical protein